MDIVHPTPNSQSCQGLVTRDRIIGQGSTLVALFQTESCQKERMSIISPVFELCTQYLYILTTLTKQEIGR